MPAFTVDTPVGKEKYDTDNEQTKHGIGHTDTNNNRHSKSKDRSRSQSRLSSSRGIRQNANPRRRGSSYDSLNIDNDKRSSDADQQQKYQQHQLNQQRQGFLRRSSSAGRRRSKSYDFLTNNNSIDKEQQQEQQQQTRKTLRQRIVCGRQEAKQLYEKKNSRSRSEIRSNSNSRRISKSRGNKKRINDLQLKIQQHLEGSAIINVNDADTVRMEIKSIQERLVVYENTHHKEQEKNDKLMNQNVQLAIEKARYINTIKELEKRCDESRRYTKIWKFRAEKAERELLIVPKEVQRIGTTIVPETTNKNRNNVTSTYRRKYSCCDDEETKMAIMMIAAASTCTSNTTILT